MQLRVHFPVNFQAKIKTLTLEKINLEILFRYFFFFAFIEEKISKMVEGRRQGQAHRRASQKRINIHSTKL